MLDFKEEIATILSKAIDGNIDELKSFIEVPPSRQMGDYAFPCFKLAKTLKKAPPAIAEDLKTKMEIDTSIIENVQIEGGYLNFFVNKNAITKAVFDKFEEQKENYGSSNMGNGKKVIVEYSSPNIAKPFHIGHLRNTIIGKALYNVYKYLGYDVVSLNHLGDYGTQFGKLIEGYKRWGDEYDIESNPIDELMKIYVRINEACKEDESVLEACRDNFKKLEEGDEYCVKIWNWFKDESLKEFNRIYDILEVSFDDYDGESFYTDKMDNVINILNKNGVLKESEGAEIIDLEDKNLGIVMVKKSNESSTYATRDLAAIKYRADTYNFDKCLYVVAYEQAAYFRQVFEAAKYLDIPEKCIDGLEHVQYGITRLTTGKMSTREGTVIKVNDLLNEAVERTLKIIEEKNPDLENKQENANRIGIGAVVFNNVSNTIIKDQVFDWDTALSFQGETGPYIQYVYVRTKGVLENVGYIPEYNKVDFNLLSDEASQNVIVTLYKFREVLENVTIKNDPSILARFLLELAQSYTLFYNENKVLVDDENIKNARGYLTYVVKEVIATGSKLLGINMPSKM